MASKGPIPIPYFFIFDSYVMKESNDNNDTLPRAISYFYPDEQIKRQVIIILYSKIKFCLIFFSNLETFGNWRNCWCCSIFST
jgi:hypothetical protein